MEIAELIGWIRKRPLVFLTNNSIVELRAFLCGFNHCKCVMTDCVDSDPMFSQFQKWVRDKYKIEDNHSWMQIILFFSANESYALDKFFELWDEFIAECEQKSGR